MKASLTKMKYLIVFALVLAVAYGLSSEDQTKIRKRVMQNAENCQKETGAKGDDIAGLLAKRTPTKTEGKCFLSCMFKKIGIQDDSGKTSIPGINKWIEDIKAMDADLSGKARQIIDTCNPKVGDSGDACDTAAAMFDCGVKTSKELGINFNFAA